MRIVKDSFLAVQVIESTWTKHAPCVPGSQLESCEDPLVCTAGWVDADRGPDQPTSRQGGGPCPRGHRSWRPPNLAGADDSSLQRDAVGVRHDDLPGAISSVGDGMAASVLAGVKPVHGL
jgi:hypothetical protein